MVNNLELLALILVLLRYTWVYLGAISDGLCMLIRGLRDRDPDVKKDGWLSVATGICGLVGTYYVGLQWISCCLSA